MTQPAVGVIGMGMAGPAVASSLRSAGYTIAGVNARSAEARDRAEAVLPGVPLLEVDEVAAKSDILVLAVPDRFLAQITDGLVRDGALRPGQVLIHLSGAVGTEPLLSAEKIGVATLALHPVMTFSGTSLDVTRMSGAWFGYTCAPVMRPLAEALIYAMGGTPVPIESGDRTLYHAGLAHGANHLVTLVAQATEVLRRAGVAEPGELQRPLLTAALDNALDRGVRGLTGPVLRGDTETVSAHIEALDQAGLGNTRDSYVQLSQATAALIADSARPEPNLESSPEQNPAQLTLQPTLVTTRVELQQKLAQGSGRIGLVMTMGALHRGHLSLIRELSGRVDRVVVTIFVNPEQFGPDEDLEKYPRTLEADLSALRGLGVDLVYAPDPEEVYPSPPLVRMDPGPAARVLEGALRPGHFAGVLQVVAKVMNLVRPTVAVFGQKDAQQFAIIKQMVQDLDQQVELIEAPIVRDEDGLALSSRNQYLTEDQRVSALALSAALRRGQHEAKDDGDPRRIVNEAATHLIAAEGVVPQYVALAECDTFRVLSLWTPGGDDLGTTEDSSVLETNEQNIDGPFDAYLLVAAKVGQTRLIDNTKVQVSSR